MISNLCLVFGSACAGMYKGGQFPFTFAISPNYPHEPPKVKCTAKVRSPRFDSALMSS